MSKIAEYRDIHDEPKSKSTVLISKFSEQIRKDVSLIHRSEGWEPAGAMARWTDEHWAVNYMIDNAIHGQRYRTEIEAKQHFDRLTTV